jgi:hypothetical protein
LKHDEKSLLGRWQWWRPRPFLLLRCRKEAVERHRKVLHWHHAEDAAPDLVVVV